MTKHRWGLFITFEGGEGSGKTTQARLLHEHLSGLGWEAILSREPGGTPLGDRLRKVLLDPTSAGMEPLAELLLYAAARREHVAKVILPALEGGVTVISDRFSDATVAYQGYGRGLDRALIGRLNRIACGDLAPDATILLDLGSAREGVRRAMERHRENGTGEREGRFEREEDRFHRDVRRGYLALARRHPGRIAVIDGARGVEEVHRDILLALAGRFKGRKWGA